MNTTITSLNNDALYDSLRVQDYTQEILQQIEFQEDLNTIEQFINNVEKAFQVNLFELRLSLAISNYNKDQSFENFNKLIPFMKNITSCALEFNNSNQAVFALPENVVSRIQSMLTQIQKKGIFNIQLEGLRYGNPNLFSIFSEAKKSKNCI